MKLGSVASIETLSTVDGPGIRVVVFLNGCKLRCKYCHNPEMWKKQKYNYTSKELVEKILRYKPYFGSNGGVTFSGGEPLLQVDFLIEVCTLLKKENINITLDTAGCGVGKYKELVSLVDLVIFDIKYTDSIGYKELTGYDEEESLLFIHTCNKLNKPIWLRQVIVPDLMDNYKYLLSLKNYIKKNIKAYQKIEFLPYHKLGSEKYLKLGIENPYIDKKEMDKLECEKLYNKFLEML